MNLTKTASEIRYTLVKMSHKTRSAHLGSCLSCVDILVYLYWEVLKNESQRDRFILSKGHAAAALYAVLAKKRFFDSELLFTMEEKDSPLEGHPKLNSVPGIEASTGSLGHGLSLGIGLAMSSKIKNEDFNVYVLQSDGECNEGSVWEAAMFASKHSLSSLTMIIDYNKWQATGRSLEIMSLKPLKAKWEAFGWDVYEIDGHNFDELNKVFHINKSKKPKVIIANTIKGKGISFMEDDNNWHYRVPTMEEVALAGKELGVK